MAGYIISEINIYPVKSLGGYSVNQTKLEDKGLQHDRRWMLVDARGNFLTQRQHAQLALLQVTPAKGGFRVTHKQHKTAELSFPLAPQTNNYLAVTVWDDTCQAIEVSSEASAWFTEVLDMPARLVMMAAETKREVDPEYAHQHEVVSFADGYPLLLIGQASLNELNTRLQQPVPMNRFRPNLVFTGGEPFEEDSFDMFRIGSISFRAAKPCARCVVTTIEQQTAVKSPEPLKTLSEFRLRNNKVMFGQNLLHYGAGKLTVGDELVVTTRK